MPKTGRKTGATRDGVREPVYVRYAGTDLELLGPDADFRVGGALSVARDVTMAPGSVLHVWHPLIFWQHTANISQVLANATWTPIAFDRRISEVGSGWSSLPMTPAATTIAAGSDGALLPQGTINVVSTAGFKAATTSSLGYLCVRISGKDTVVQYTGQTATSFTGCTFGSGTLAIGQAVTQANVEFSLPVRTLGPLVAELAWASSAIGLRGTRMRSLHSLGAGIHLNGATDVRAAGVASTDPLIRSTCAEQPAWLASGPYRIEGYQSSGGPLDCAPDQLAAPRLVIQALSDIVI